jgi:hypothetical protein
LTFFELSYFGIFCHATIVVILVLPLSLVHHRQDELAINDKQILYLLSKNMPTISPFGIDDNPF